MVEFEWCEIENVMEGFVFRDVFGGDFLGLVVFIEYEGCYE